jgi:hypothetical protein
MDMIKYFVLVDVIVLILQIAFSIYFYFIFIKHKEKLNEIIEIQVYRSLKDI